MKNFTYYTPTMVKFGLDTVKDAPALVREFGGTSVLVVYGGHSAKDSGLIDAVTSELEQANIPFTCKGGCKPNPRFSFVQDGVALARNFGADFILAVGGGSVIDAAKGIAYGIKYQGENLWNLWDRKEKASGAAPVGVVLTIAAAGSEMSDSCVLTNNGVKRGYSSNYGRCRFAILDPALTLSLPKYQTMCGCADILMHTLERYLSAGEHMQITDEISEGLMRTVLDQTKILENDLSSLNARAEIMWCSSLSHNGLTECGTVKDFSCHALGHELSGMFDVAHGASLTAVWPSWAMLAFQHDVPRFAKFARTVLNVNVENDEATAFTGIQKLKAWFEEMGLPVNLPQLGLHLDEDQLKVLAHNCAVASGGKKGTAWVMTEPEILQVYEAANSDTEIKTIG